MSKLDSDVINNDKSSGKRIATVNLEDCSKNAMGCAKQLSHYVCNDRYTEEQRKNACMCGVNMIISPDTAKNSLACKSLK